MKLRNYRELKGLSIKEAAAAIGVSDVAWGYWERGQRMPEALEHGLDHLVQAQPVPDVQLGREPDLRIHHPVSGQVRGAFRGYPDQRRPRLHHPDSVLEGLQVELEPAALRRAGHRSEEHTSELQSLR